ncbi:MAG: tRNA epoxyqueuosine(34) reductase QueG [Rhizobiales bacterium]|nr:tRNA epoxyqueuosine(34) reductase QueG [Hyphomicrobiales bacterium]
MMKSELKLALQRQALTEGFDLVGITSADLPELNKIAFSEFLINNWHGDMLWMEEKKQRRENPSHLWPEAKSVIMLAMNYGPEQNPLPELRKTKNGVLSCYAKGKDYHDIVKKKLKNLARWFVTETGAEVKVFVDTAPVMEKPLAMQAGIGWQGKHTNIVSPKLGSWTFLGAIFTTEAIEIDEPEKDHCGSCRKCLDICPTNAFPKAYQLEATKCISYLTIEHQGMIDRELRSKMGNRIYGCDDCLAICPWNKFAKKAEELRFLARDEIDNPPLKELLKLDDESFRKKFSGTPIKRTGRDRFIRNCLIAAGNSKDQELVQDVQNHLRDENELVRATSVWAMEQLLQKEDFTKLKQTEIVKEKHPLVLSEWHKSEPENE